jgi:hypothetical protein
MWVDRRLSPRMHEGFELVVKGWICLVRHFWRTQGLEPFEGLCFLLCGRFQPRESGAWCQSSDVLENLGSGARGLGFRKV